MNENDLKRFLEWCVYNAAIGFVALGVLALIGWLMSE